MQHRGYDDRRDQCLCSRSTDHHRGRAQRPACGPHVRAKDLFDVAGHPTGGGNHDWARANPIPARHAWAAQTLLDAGVKEEFILCLQRFFPQTDGHVTDNAFVFAVGEAVIPSNITQNIAQKSVVYIPKALARFPTLVGQVIIVGGAFGTLWLWRPVNKIEAISLLISEVRKKIDKRLVSIFLIGSIILLVSDIAILAFQAQAISAGILDVITTRFGIVVLARTILSLVLFSISLLAFRTNRRSPQILTRGETAGILSLGLSLLLTTSMIGHGAANNQFSSIAIDFAHNLAVLIMDWWRFILRVGFYLETTGRQLS